MVGDNLADQIAADLPVEDRAADKPSEDRRHAAGKRAPGQPAPAIRCRTYRLAPVGPTGNRRADPGAERGWRRVVRHLALDAGAQARQLVAARGAIHATHHVLLDLGALHRIE